MHPRRGCPRAKTESTVAALKSQQDGPNMKRLPTNVKPAWAELEKNGWTFKTDEKSEQLA